MEFVVNEWLPEYFKPTATNEEKQKLEKFLNTFLTRDDKIFVRRPSEFLKKIYRYSKDYQNYSKTSHELSKFISIILLDSSRCFFVDDNEFELATEVVNKLTEGGNTISDQYLFEAATKTKTSVIVTTDKKLQTLMNNKFGFKVVLLDEFLKNY